MKLYPLRPEGTWFRNSSDTEPGTLWRNAATDPSLVTWVNQGTPTATDTPMIITGVADLSSAVGATINEMREAIAIQQLFEKDARGGTRYPEILMSHFQVSDPMFQVLQRPLYLGGGSSPVNITPIATTSNIASVGGEGTTGGGFSIMNCSLSAGAVVKF